jgi:WD40 repeat protein
MQLRNAKDLSLLRSFPSPFTPSADDWYSAWALSPGGRTLALGQGDGHVRVWNTADQKYLNDFAAHAGRITACRYSEDARILATVGEDQKVRVWETQTGKILHEYEAPPFAHRLYFSRDGRKLACAHWNEEHTHGSVRVWDLKESGEIVTFPAHLEQIWDIAFSPDGQTLATGSPDSTAKLWDLNDVTQPKFVLRGRLLAVISLDFSPAGRRLAVSGDSGETKIWDVRTGQELVSLKGGDGFIRHTVFVDEDTLLTAGGTSGPRTELFLWHAPSVAEVAAAETDEKKGAQR